MVTLDTNCKRSPNPRENANFFSIIMFLYTIPLFFKGWKRDLEENNLYETLTEDRSGTLGDRIEAMWNEEKEKASKEKREPSLNKILIKTFGPKILFVGVFVAVNEIIFKMAQPFFIGQLVLHFMPNGNHISLQHAYLYAGGIILCSLINVFCFHPVTMTLNHLGMKIRLACSVLIYRKALRLNHTAMGKTSVGQIVNLLSNDVNRFDSCLTNVHYLWVGPLQIVIVTYFVSAEFGITGAIGVTTLLLFIGFLYLLITKIAALKAQTAQKTDERVRLMNEMISGIRVIKMYTWEKPFQDLVDLARRAEMKIIRWSTYGTGIMHILSLIFSRIYLFLTILIYFLLGNEMDARKAFILITLYNVVKENVLIYFSKGLFGVLHGHVSTNRIVQFLVLEEYAASPLNDQEDLDQYKKYNKDIVIIRNSTAKWAENSNEDTIKNLNLTIKDGALIALIGPVGGGKSSLLHVILKELPLKTGSVGVKGKVSYASQESWIISGSVEENILFRQKMNRSRFKTVVQVCGLEKDLSAFPFRENTIVGERGILLSGGQRARISLARAVYRQAQIYLLDDPLSAVDTHVGKQIFQECIKGFLRDKTVILVTHQLQYLKEVDQIVIVEDGQIKCQGSFDVVQTSNLDFAKLLKKGDGGIDERNSGNSITSRNEKEANEMEGNIGSPKLFQESRSIGSISASVYKAYLKANGRWWMNSIAVFLVVLSKVSGGLVDYFLAFWMNLEQKRKDIKLGNGNNTLPDNNHDFWNFSTETCIVIYSALIVFMLAIAIVGYCCFIVLSLRALVNLHDKMLKSITRATMRFFNTNNSGIILNRFSKDMGCIDTFLPLSLLLSLQMFSSVLTSLVVIVVVKPWFLLPTVVIGILYWIMGSIYIKTSRALKRLEAINRSPVFAQVNASLQGLSTIRAFSAQGILEKEFDDYQDLHTSAWFAFISSSAALELWLELFCVVYIALVMFYFLYIGNEKYGGNVGLAITQVLGLVLILQYGIKQLAELPIQMTSVERVLEYSAVEQEKDLKSSEDNKPPSTWPDKGEIQLQNLCLSYSHEAPPVLKDLNVLIHPLEKVGIVGRTAAGKSSLVSALFQLHNTTGSILVDKIDISKLGLDDLRSKISIIPQEPVIFSGTLRKNLDPFDEYQDDVLWKALADVELKEVVHNLSAGLNSKLAEKGTNLSIGQRQLICLARALILKNKILVLDEATSNVDEQTDVLIQKTIRTKFENCTVLTIAHRLNTIMDSDKVLVMDGGKIVEYDHPHVLLNKKGVFFGMVQQTGPSMAETLIRMSEHNYNNRTHVTTKL